MRIIKRDGREVPYDYTKIKRAIEAANGEVAKEDRLSDTEIGFIVGRIEQRCAALERAIHTLLPYTHTDRPFSHFGCSMVCLLFTPVIRLPYAI